MKIIENARLYEISLVPAESLPYPWNEICIVEVVSHGEG